MSTYIPEGYPGRDPTIGIGRYVAVDDLATVAELAEEHGVSRRAVTYWLAEPECPPPLAELAVGRIYSRTEIRIFRRRRRDRDAQGGTQAARRDPDRHDQAPEAPAALQ